MTGFGQQELQTAIYQKITGDSTIMALLAGVYDFVPEYASYPYLTLGESTWSDASNLGAEAAACVVGLRIFSRQGGRAETAAIMKRLHTLLHNGTLSPTGFTVVFIRFESGQVELEDDGVTYQGVMRFNALLQGE